jgi:hypothetical protein
MDEGVDNALIWAADQAQEMFQLEIDAQLWAAQQEALVGLLAADPQLAWRLFPEAIISGGHGGQATKLTGHGGQ